MISFHQEEELLNKIHFIMERIVVFDGIGEVLEHIVKNAVSMTRAESATLRIFDVKTGKLHIKASHGLSDGYLNAAPLKLGEGILGRVVLTGNPFMTNDVSVEKHCMYKELAKKEGINSIISVPLKTKQTTIGCLTVYRKTEDKFTDSELMILNILSSQSTEAIEKTKMLEDLKKQATYDLLTEVYNRNYILKRFEEETKRSARFNLLFSLIFIDIDDFKKFNDEHGHLYGDKLLVDLVGVIKKNLRKNDIVGRYGGEEFIILAPETDKKGGLILAEKILKAVNDYSFIGTSGEINNVSFSAGVASFPEDGKSSSELIGKADNAMYMAKKNGKNRVEACCKTEKEYIEKK